MGVREISEKWTRRAADIHYTDNSFYEYAQFFYTCLEMNLMFVIIFQINSSDSSFKLHIEMKDQRADTIVHQLATSAFP